MSITHGDVDASNNAMIRIPYTILRRTKTKQRKWCQMILFECHGCNKLIVALKKWLNTTYAGVKKNTKLCYIRLSMRWEAVGRLLGITETSSQCCNGIRGDTGHLMQKMHSNN